MAKRAALLLLLLATNASSMNKDEARALVVKALPGVDVADVQTRAIAS